MHNSNKRSVQGITAPRAAHTRPHRTLPLRSSKGSGGAPIITALPSLSTWLRTKHANLILVDFIVNDAEQMDGKPSRNPGHSVLYQYEVAHLCLITLSGIVVLEPGLFRGVGTGVYQASKAGQPDEQARVCEYLRAQLDVP